MSGVDDEWQSFLSQGAIILSNEKNSAKNNVTNSYQKNMDSTMTSYTAIIDTRYNTNSTNSTNATNATNATNSTNSTNPNTVSRDTDSSSLSKSLKIKEYSNIKQKINLSSLSTLSSHSSTQKVKNNKNKKTLNNCCFKEGHGVDDVDGDIDDGDGDEVGGEVDGDDCEYTSIDMNSGMNTGMVIDDIDNETHVETPEKQPVCSKIYISTKTKISYLNEPIDIKKVFWSIPVSSYSTPSQCIIKKQIKVSTTDPNELKEIRELLKNEKYYQEQEIEHIDNPEGRIKFKVQLKINVGLCKKDILNYRCKLKRAFFNCFVLIMRIHDQSGDAFKEMHIKVFNTGKLEIPGIQTDESLEQVLTLLISTLKPIVGPHIDYIRDKCETVLINSNFNCGYFINRDKLYNILKYKYRINSSYDSCSYPGIQSKFYYVPGLEIQTGQHPPANEIDKANEISFMIFRTGSVLIVGRCDENVLHCIYDFLKKILEIEYPEIGNKLNIIQPKKQNVKLRRKVINVVEDI